MKDNIEIWLEVVLICISIVLMPFWSVICPISLKPSPQSRALCGAVCTLTHLSLVYSPSPSVVSFGIDQYYIQ